jgi:hypothetical protein
MRAPILLLLLLCSGVAVAAETGYKVTHPDGSVEFTDQPAPNAKPIPLPDIPTYTHRTPDASKLGTKRAKPQIAPPAYERVAITSPARDATLWRNEGPVTVTVQTRPALHIDQGDRLVILLDGKKAAEGSAMRYTLTQVYRGTHSVVAVVRDVQGRELARSQAVTFHMRQHSVLFKKKSGG